MSETRFGRLLGRKQIVSALQSCFSVILSGIPQGGSAALGHMHLFRAKDWPGNIVTPGE